MTQRPARLGGVRLFPLRHFSYGLRVCRILSGTALTRARQPAGAAMNKRRPSFNPSSFSDALTEKHYARKPGKHEKLKRKRQKLAAWLRRESKDNDCPRLLANKVAIKALVQVRSVYRLHRCRKITQSIYSHFHTVTRAQLRRAQYLEYAAAVFCSLETLMEVHASTILNNANFQFLSAILIDNLSQASVRKQN